MKKLFLILLFISSLFSKELKKTSIQLMWLDQFQFAGFYIAKEKGFYEELGLDVELKKFSDKTNVLNEVIEGRADFGISSSSLIIDKSNNKDISILGAVFQTSPLMLLALKDSNINSIQDFKDRKLMITGEQLEFATFKAMLVSQNVNINSIKIIPHSFNVDDLINKNTDLMLSYTTNEPFILKEKGYESKIFYPKDYGFDFYEEIIFSNSSLIKDDPKLVKDFYNATIRGWKWAFDNIPESVDIIYNKYNSQNKSIDALLFEAMEMKKLVFDEHGRIGTLSKEKINLIINTYKVMGLIKNDIDLNEFIFNHNDNFDIYLSKDEINYLKQKESIKYCSHHDLMPFESIKDGKHIGVLEEYIQYMSKNLNVDFKFIPTSSWHESLNKTINKECDILTTIASKKNREELLNFTSPFIDFPFVIATDITKPFIENINNLKNEKIAVVKDFATSKIIKEKYKNLTVIEYPSLHHALEAVKNHEVFAAIDSLAVIGYEIQNHFLGEIKVSGKIDEQLKLYMATNIDNQILTSILDKSLNSISEQQRQLFFNKWLSINYQNSINYDFILKLSILLVVLFIIFAIIYRTILLKKINKNLEERVAYEIMQNEEKNKILMQQSKMAAMGEMLENIAHQWRQPLSTISVCASGIELKKSMNVLEDKDFYDSINHIKTSISYLTNTIEDFRSFLDQNKFISNIHSIDIVKRVLDILNPSFISHNIKVVQNIEDFEFASLENEIIQVLMNIFANAKDALKENKNLENRYIFIDIKKESDNILIEIYDNALGINSKIIDRIFEPYFTTKHKSQGTGIGLYMSKLLVDTHLKGEISVSNKEFEYNNNKYIGASFKIKISNLTK